MKKPLPEKEKRLESVKRLEAYLSFDSNLTTFFVEGNHAIGQGEERVVASHTYVLTGMETGAALAYDDVAGDDALAAELLDSEALRSAVASVFTGSLSFFMGHGSLFLKWD